MVWNTAIKLGQSEQFVRDNYSKSELIERSMYDEYKQYVNRELNKT